MASTVASCISGLLFLLILFELLNMGQMNDVEDHSFGEDFRFGTISEQCDCSTDCSTIDCGSLELHEFPSWDDSILEKPCEFLLVLNFNFNRLTKVPQFKKTDEIIAIYINHNKISDIVPFAFTDLANLKTLILLHNQLSEIPTDAFSSSDGSPLPLEILDLSNNYIYSFKADDFKHLTKLKELSLVGNNFATLDASSVSALNGLLSLKILNLSENVIGELPITLKETVARLHTFNLSLNKLQRVPEVLQFGEKMTNLALSGNRRIKELNAQSFMGLENTQVLEINNMESLVKILNGTFIPMKSLEKLICNNNTNLKLIEVNSFSNSFGGHANLKQVELKNNSLSTLNAAVFKNITACSIDLTGNKLKCDCGIAWLIADNIRIETKCFYLHDSDDTFPKELNITDVDVYCVHEESLNNDLFWATLGILIGLLLLCIAAVLTRKFCKGKSQNTTMAPVPLHRDRQYVRNGTENFDGKVCTRYTQST